MPGMWCLLDISACAGITRCQSFSCSASLCFMSTNYQNCVFFPGYRAYGIVRQSARTWVGSWWWLFSPFIPQRRFLWNTLCKDSGLWGRAVGLSLAGSLALPVPVWGSSSTFPRESIPAVPGVTVPVLPPRRTFGIKLKITLSATRDDEGGWMAGPRLHSRVVLNFNSNQTSPDCTSPVSMLYWRRKLTS